MPISVLSIRWLTFARKTEQWYNTPYKFQDFDENDRQTEQDDKANKDNKDNEKEREKTMKQILERINTYEVPPNVAKQLGLDKDWKNKVSPDFLYKVANNAQKYRELLKRLSVK